MIYTIFKKVSFHLLLLFFGLCFLALANLWLKTKPPISQPLVKEITQQQIKNRIVELSAGDDIIHMDNVPVKKGNLSSKYGIRKDPFNGRKRMHHGIDIAARSGTNIFPLGKGTVIFSGRKSGYGNIVEILHGKNIVSRYAHIKKSLVKKGQTVTKKDVIALVGSTGRSTGPHLHLEIAINGETIDPEIFLIGNLASY